MGLMDAQRKQHEKSMYNVTAGKVALINGKVTRYGGLRPKKWPAKDCTAELVTDGAEGSRVTASRVAAGAVLAGPVGAVVGGMAKKGLGTGWLIVQTPDGEFREKVKGAKVAKARTFVMNLGMESERQARG